MGCWLWIRSKKLSSPNTFDLTYINFGGLHKSGNYNWSVANLGLASTKLLLLMLACHCLYSLSVTLNKIAGNFWSQFPTQFSMFQLCELEQRDRVIQKIGWFSLLCRRCRGGHVMERLIKMCWNLVSKVTFFLRAIFRGSLPVICFHTTKVQLKNLQNLFQ